MSCGQDFPELQTGQQPPKCLAKTRVGFHSRTKRSTGSAWNSILASMYNTEQQVPLMGSQKMDWPWCDEALILPICLGAASQSPQPKRKVQLIWALAVASWDVGSSWPLRYGKIAGSLMVHVLPDFGALSRAQGFKHVSSF
jgi:hypothetical protein